MLSHTRTNYAIGLVAFSAAIGAGFLSIDYIMYPFGRCETIIRNLIPSPDGRQSIVIFQRECGATVGFNTQASIAEAGRIFSTEEDPPFLVISGSPEIIAKWAGDHVVEVALIKGGDKVLRSEQSVGEIQVVYK